jgi:hypothetical protein
VARAARVRGHDVGPLRIHGSDGLYPATRDSCQGEYEEAHAAILAAFVGSPKHLAPARIDGSIALGSGRCSSS